MDPRSEANLLHVHPDLCKVLRLADQAPQGFVVICGLRSCDAERKAVASGNSQTTHSRHFPNAQGYVCAVDVDALLPNGMADPQFAHGREEEVFGRIAASLKRAAALAGVPIQWGGDEVGAWTPGVVSHFRDWGHFQLPWKEYP